MNFGTANHPYAPQMDMMVAGVNPAAGNVYYPAASFIHPSSQFASGNGGRSGGYGLRFGSGPSGGGGGYGSQGGYGHSGYGGNIGVTGGGHGPSPYDHPGAGGVGGGILGGGGGGLFSGKLKSKGASSVMTGLTLLSFFFFLGTLSNCLKDHMEAMNPTVMVMTAGVSRNRLNKLAEMNSREPDDKYFNDDYKLSLAREEQEYSYPNRSSHRHGDLQTKSKNDYFDNMDTYYTRIN